MNTATITNTYTTQKLYNPEYSFFLDEMHALDLSGLLTYQWHNNRLVAEFLLINSLWNTKRYFQESALKCLNIPNRTNILKSIRKGYINNLCSISNFKLITNEIPKSGNDLLDFDLKFLYYNQNVPYAPNLSFGGTFDYAMQTYEKITEIIDHVSVYEWLAFYCTHYTVPDLVNHIKDNINIINDKCKASPPPIELNHMGAIFLTTFNELGNEMICRGERPKP